MDHRSRQNNFQQALADSRLDGFVVTHPANLRYLCGYTGSNGLLLFLGGRPVFFTDGRYTQQARDEIQGARIVIAKGPLLAEAGKHFGRARSCVIGFEADHTTVVAAAERQIGVFEGQLAQADATLAQQRAMEHQAELNLNLSYTTITAPVDGTVGVRTLRVGQYVEAGTQLMAVAPLQAVYVVANYKETQLTDVQPGQRVTIDIDTFPGTKVHGHVDSLAPASGQEFALLPPDNATGNFTKVVQRIPVKIEIDKNEPLLGRLRPGMSVEPTIDTRPVSAASSSGKAS